MIALVEQAGRSTDRPSYELKVVLKGTSPIVWRRLHVPADANLGWLHAVLQVAMGWTNSHLHKFQAGDRTYSDSEMLEQGFLDAPPILDEHGVTVGEVLPIKNAVLEYEYDFGDSWRHEVKLETILKPGQGLVKLAQCVEGSRACPPEDCGGIPGYAAF